MGYATDGQLPRDTNGAPAEGVYSPGVGTVAQQAGNVTTDIGGQPSAPALIQLLTGVANQVAADSIAAASLLMLVQSFQTGTGLFSPRRLATKLVPLAAVAITAGTPVSVYTPTSGKKYRVLGFAISDTVAGAVKFEDGTGNEVFRTPLLAASTPYNSPDMGNGFLSAAANNQLFLDVTVTGNVSGFIAIMEE